MKRRRGATIFLRIVIVGIAVGALALLLWAPRVEGRNVGADLVTIYFRDPFLAFMYLGSLPFFVALFHAFKLLGHIARDEAFSQAAVNTLRNIKYCALLLVAALVGGMAYIRLASGDDDPAGAIAVGILVTFATLVVATAAAIFQELLQNAVDFKSENDLTV